jgi:hypothetical protein
MGFFFLEYYSILLTPILGIVVILLAVTMTVIISARQVKIGPRKKHYFHNKKPIKCG